MKIKKLNHKNTKRFKDLAAGDVFSGIEDKRSNPTIFIKTYGGDAFSLGDYCIGNYHPSAEVRLYPDAILDLEG